MFSVGEEIQVTGFGSADAFRMSQHRQNWSHIASESATQFLYISHKFGPTKVFPICVSAGQYSWVALLYAVDYHIPTAQCKKKKDKPYLSIKEGSLFVLCITLRYPKLLCPHHTLKYCWKTRPK
jgi:hypothetical protein